MESWLWVIEEQFARRDPLERASFSTIKRLVTYRRIAENSKTKGNRDMNAIMVTPDDDISYFRNVKHCEVPSWNKIVGEMDNLLEF